MALMKCIAENPFRVLGLPVTATDREIVKQVNKLSTYYEYGKTVNHDTDFPVFSEVQRSPELIAEAASRIELPDQKLFYANFWFWSANSVDQLVMEVLGDGNVDKALALWEKSALSGSLSEKNMSSFRNLALLNLIQATQEEAVGTEHLKLALDRFGQSFSNDSYTLFCSAVVGGEFRGDTLKSQMSFVNELYAHLGLAESDANRDVASVFVSGLAAAGGVIGGYVKSRLVEAPIHRIEKAVSVAEAARKQDAGESFASALQLGKEVESDVEFLKDVLPEGDIHYQSISDQVAQEILASSTSYYNANHELDETTGTIGKSRQLTFSAQSFAVSKRMETEIAEDLAILGKLDEEHSLREPVQRFNSIIEQLPSLGEITEFQARAIPVTLTRVLDLVSPVLSQMKEAGGEGNEVYAQRSDYLASYGLALCTEYVNQTGGYDKALPLINRLARLQMSATTQVRYLLNTDILNRNIAVKSQNSGACYIATMAFGSYEAPEVLVLREYRDQRLACSSFGRLCIRCYYKVSPGLVFLLKDSASANRAARYFLRRFIGVDR